MSAPTRVTWRVRWKRNLKSWGQCSSRRKLSASWILTATSSLLSARKIARSANTPPRCWAAGSKDIPEERAVLAVRAPTAAGTPGGAASGTAARLLLELIAAGAGVGVVLQLTHGAGSGGSLRGSLSGLCRACLRRRRRLAGIAGTTLSGLAVGSRAVCCRAARSGAISLLRAVRGGAGEILRLRVRSLTRARWILLLVVLLLSLGGAGRRINGRPTAVVPFAPVAVGIFLVNVAVGACIHVVVIRIFRDEAAVAIRS